MVDQLSAKMIYILRTLFCFERILQYGLKHLFDPHTDCTFPSPVVATYVTNMETLRLQRLCSNLHKMVRSMSKA